MFGYKNSTGRTLILVSVLAVTGGVAVAERDGRGPGDGDRPAHRQGDREGKRGDQGERGEWGERGEHGPRGERGDRPGRPSPERMHRRLFADMDLTDEQRDQIRETMKAFGDERKAWHEANRDEFQALREKMRDAHQGDDKDAAKAVREEIKALMESAPKPDAAHDEVRALLNEEQQVVFDERIAKIRERMEQWKEGRGAGPPHGRGGFGPGEDGPPKDGRRARGAKLFGNLDLTDDQKASLRETMQSDMTREEKKAAVREMLNDDQKAQFDENVKKMRKYREEHKGERGDRSKRHDRGGDRDGEGPNRDRKPDSDSQLDL